MAERRALIDEISKAEDLDPQLAEEFIYSQKPLKAGRSSVRTPEPAQATTEETSVSPPLPPTVVSASRASTAFPFMGAGKVAIGARVRPELAGALKRTSLERQLQGIEPYALQDILEEALELWLHKHGQLR
jgi:hypothetical protein